MLVSRCICRRLTLSEFTHLDQVFFFFCEQLPRTRGLTLFLLLVSNFPLALPLHLNVTSVSHQFISGMNYSLSNSAISRSHQALGDFDVDIPPSIFLPWYRQQVEHSESPAAVRWLAWALAEQLVSDFQMRCHAGGLPV